MFKRWFEHKHEKEEKSRLEQLVTKFKDGHSFTNDESREYHELRFLELPEWIVTKSREVLGETLTAEDKLKIYVEMEKDPYHWVSPYHFGWGTAIRNLLRNKVCLDAQLPSEWGWDDYYSQLIEVVVLDYHERMMKK